MRGIFRSENCKYVDRELANVGYFLDIFYSKNAILIKQKTNIQPKMVRTSFEISYIVTASQVLPNKSTDINILPFLQVIPKTCVTIL